MKRTQQCLVLTLLSLCLLIPSIAFAEAEVGEPAPNFKAVDSNGTAHELSEYKGHPVVLEWTNPDCPYVVKHYDTKNMQSLQKKYTDQGVIWLTINSSAPGKQGNIDGAAANKYIAEKGAAQTAYLLDSDGKVGKLYEAKTTPHMFVIDNKGTLVYAGAIDDNSSSRHSTVEGATNYVAEALDSLMADKPIDVAATRAYGCSVKYAS